MHVFTTYVVPAIAIISAFVSLFFFYGAWSANGANHLSEFARLIFLVIGTIYGVFAFVGAWITYSHLAV